MGDEPTTEDRTPVEAEPRRLVEENRRRGRGARSNRAGRFESELREAFDDGWESLARALFLSNEFVYVD